MITKLFKPLKIFSEQAVTDARYLFALQHISTGLPAEPGRAKETFFSVQLRGRADEYLSQGAEAW